ncbi:MAG: hypothetical protein GDA66_04500 [Nitrospira sp. CR1.2]|nr:hypothetical protein [Nitrospira sp. CR1.2]
MADAPVSASRLPRTWLPALVISLLVSGFCAAALYVLLAGHDRSLVAQRNATAVITTERSAHATARTLAWFVESLGGDSLAAIQQTLEQHAQQANLLSSTVITEDNVVVAAGNPAAVGTQLQDAAWLNARKSQSSVITSGMEKGRPAVIVVEPIRRDNRIAGWIRLAVAAPPDAAAPRSEDDLALDVALVVVPLLLVLFTLLILTMGGLMSRVRKLLGRILIEAQEQLPRPLDAGIDTPSQSGIA